MSAVQRTLKIILKILPDRNLCYLGSLKLMVSHGLIMKGGSTWALLCEQRLHFRCVSWFAKSSLCQQPLKLVQKSGQINLKSFFPLFLAGLEHCVSLVWVLCSRSELSQFFFLSRNSHHLMIDLKINFACESRDEFCTCTIENWMVVGKGYFSHDSSHSENVASAHGVLGPFCAVELWVIKHVRVPTFFLY